MKRGSRTTARVVLRHDKVAERFTDRVSDALQWIQPDGHTLVVTIDAPIRKWALTAEIVTQLLADGRGELEELVLGNHVCARRLRGGSGVRVFVHDPGVPFETLLAIP